MATNFDPEKEGATPFDPVAAGATPAENGILPSIVNFGKAMISSPLRFGKGVGESQKLNQDQETIQRMVDADTAIMDKNMIAANKARSMGNMEGYQRLIDENRKIAERMSGYTGKNVTETAQRTEKGMEDTVKGGVGTAAFFVPGGNNPLTRIGTSTLAGGMAGYGGSAKGEELPSIAAGALVGGSVATAAEAAPLIKKAITESKIGEKVMKPITNLGRNVKDVIKNPTMGGAGRKVGELATEGTEKGLNISWDQGENSLVSQIDKEINKKFVNNMEIRAARDKVIANLTKTPETGVATFGPSQAMPQGKTLPVIGETTFTPEELLKTRTQLQNTYGKNIFKQIFNLGNKNEEKIAGIARDVVSKNLHNLVPETLSPDNALRIYHSLGMFGKWGLPGLIVAGVLGKEATSKALRLIDMVNKVSGGLVQ